MRIIEGEGENRWCWPFCAAEAFSRFPEGCVETLSDPVGDGRGGRGHDSMLFALERR